MIKYKSHWQLPASLLLFLICFYAGAKGIRWNALALDEPFSVLHAQFSIKAIITELSKGNNPPLYEILLHFWIKIFGISEFAVRLLSNLFMSIAVIFVFQIGRLFSNKVAWFAGLLFIFSNYQTIFAHEARSYALFVLLTSISMFSFINLFIGEKNKYWPVILVISNVLLVYCHFFGFFVWFVQALCVVAINKSVAISFKRYLKLTGISILCYLPYMYIVIHRFYDSATGGTWIAPVRDLGSLHNIVFLLTNQIQSLYILSLTIIWISVQQFIFKTQWSIVVKYTLVIISGFFLFFAFSINSPMPYYWEFTSNPVIMILYLLFLVLMITIACSSSKLNPRFKIVLIWFLAPLLIMFVSSIWVPMFMENYVVYTLPAFYLLLSIAVFQFEKEIQYAVGVLLVALMVITSVPNIENNRDVRGLVNKTKEVKGESSVMYICPDFFDMNFTYYYNQEYFTNINETQPIKSLRKQLAADNIFPIMTCRGIDTTTFSKVDNIIYLDAGADFSYQNNRILEFLKTRFGKDSLYFSKDIFRLHVFRTSRK